jgi:hypothetical protein
MTTTNTRIQEFILEATVTTDVYNPDTGITHYREFFDHEKFAELIVKECFDVVIADGRFHDAKGVIRAGKGVAMEHFGVKE